MHFPPEIELEFRVDYYRLKVACMMLMHNGVKRPGKKAIYASLASICQTFGESAFDGCSQIEYLWEEDGGAKLERRAANRTATLFGLQYTPIAEDFPLWPLR